ncbi:MAG: 50S ribosomal protein L18 [Nanoarchaeota archaeon]|nr:50S ribosomal protein L18 [Nanoarchaeota archaeon]MBU1103751.1 50S ribosomal protein L18 [Nanoarchaeota archaeon]
MKTLKRRRKQAKTDYKARFTMLKSEKPRLVVRKTNHYIIAQIVESQIAQDKVVAKASSQELLEKGWPKEKSGSLKSLPAAYLTGFLLVKNIKTKVNEAILDFGLNRNIHGSRIYALVKGAIDAGLKIPHKESTLPKTERIEANEKLKSIFKEVKEKL